ncbi:23S rRNA (guanosine(2251)-2'-O)-methyltransferase RlmB [Spiroplasma sp. BIUS-1]|uniref:23S rRNA (guanosine(2251)-2'-O)-methyltransferase RlmB n=1 Tax=Spiroplasma sp. BIUS-1 TaxID=216964 RepID=UPI0013978314|nr:23S rRNA (guanosine(2251)-2'-O)-methyltransferase RlmB [Spiroplasma sp. BIUS-1]QHX36284.1 23S rRNA (guanosine2251-2'-O)-methyltransferase [Spiroplasma sp. BIUS-1]
MKNYIYGKNAVENIIKNFRVEIKQVFILKGHSFDPEIYKIIKENKIEWFSLEKKEFNALIKEGVNHQGLIAQVRDFTYLELKDFHDNSKLNQKVLILDKIQDPQNFGSIIRTASLFGVDGIIIQETNQVQVTPAVMKASAGTIYNVPIIKVSNLKSAISVLKDRGFWVYSSYLSDESVPIEDIDFDKKSAIILGNEGKGIGNKLVEMSDFSFKINTTNVIDSLNVSVATGIILFELSKK